MKDKEREQLKQLKTWLAASMCLSQKELGKRIKVVKEKTTPFEEARLSRLYLFTDNYRYCISLTGSNKAYLGCTLTSTRWEAGEDWHRGSDLPDGKFNKTTFNRIWAAIVKREFNVVATPLPSFDSVRP